MNDFYCRNCGSTQDSVDITGTHAHWCNPILGEEIMKDQVLRVINFGDPFGPCMLCGKIVYNFNHKNRDDPHNNLRGRQITVWASHYQQTIFNNSPTDVLIKMFLPIHDTCWSKVKE